MKKNLLSLIITISWIIFLLNISYSDENICNYTIKVDKCLDANKDWSTRSLSESEKFMCIEWSREEIIYQIILDEKFSEIDDEIDWYLTNLEEQKNKYFWPSAISNYIEAVDEIESKFAIWWEYWKQYNAVCWIELIKEVQSCQDWTTSNINAKDYFKNTQCMNLVKLKLHIYRQVSYDILMLNKLNVRQDSAKEHMQEERIKYDEILDSMMINSWYMERISKKWPSKLLNTH